MDNIEREYGDFVIVCITQYIRNISLQYKQFIDHFLILYPFTKVCKRIGLE